MTIQPSAGVTARESPPPEFEWFMCSPAPSLLLDAQGRLLLANDACATLMAPHRLPGAEASVALQLSPQGTTALRSLLEASSGPVELDRGAGVTPRWLRASARMLSSGQVLLFVQDIDAEVNASAEATRLSEALALVQQFGRLGVWERDLDTLQGRWDRQVNRFWGMDEGAPTPDRNAAALAIVEEDREGVERSFRESLQRAGPSSHRYRVRGQDGMVRELHSFWVTKPGPDGRLSRAIGVIVDDTQSLALARSHGELTSQMALVIDLAQLVIWRHDLASGQVFVQGHASEVLGIAEGRDRVPLEELRATMRPEDLPLVLASTDEALRTGRPSDAQVHYTAVDGSVRTVLTRRVVQRDGAGAPVAFVGVALDITERDAATQRASEMARRFDVATRAAGVGWWSQEGATDRTIWSDQMRALHRLPAEEPVPLLSEWLQTYVHPDDRADVRRRFAEWVRQGTGVLEGDFRIIDREGEVHELLTHSMVEQVGQRPVLFGVVVDVTEHRSAMMALRRAEERAALAARGAGLGTWEVDLRDGRVWWDEPMWRLRGLAPQPVPLAKLDMLALVHPDDRERVLMYLDEADLHGRPGSQEFRIVWPDGSVHWLASRSGLVNDANGKPVRRIGLNWDITDARTADAARQERELALRASEAKSKFLARMSHELRTPLNAVLGFTQLMLQESAVATGPDVRRQWLQTIESAGQHLLRLINDVLDLTSVEGGEVQLERRPVALGSLFAATLPLVAPAADERGVTVQAQDFAEEPGLTVLADETRLRQVLLNLLSNAIKYNRPGGSVMLRTARVGRWVELRVEDTGHGLSDEQRRHLFEPFNRLGNESGAIEGSGIGLVIVKSLVERMGGSVVVDSAPGVGTVVTLRLPDAATETVPSQGGVAEPVRAPAHQPGGRVLYIEDNPVNALIVQELLIQRPGVTLEIAVDGQSGLAQARRLNPDLVLLDMQLPDMDGFEVLRRLRNDSVTAGIPCVAVSANVMPEEVARARAAGVDDYLTKPIDLMALQAAIDRWLAARSLQR